MTVVLFLAAALVIGAVGVAAGIIIAPVLTRAADRMGAERTEEAEPRDDERD